MRKQKTWIRQRPVVFKAVCAVLLFSLGTLSSVRAQVTFTPVTDSVLVQESGEFFSAQWGDYDNDGYLDVILRGDTSSAWLYHNEGDGTFAPVTEGALVTDPPSADLFWVDLDNDGNLDLYGVTPAGVKNVFYRNQSGGDFLEVEYAWLDGVQPGRSFWTDYDGDGHLDLHIGTDSGISNQLLHNNGDGAMTSVEASPYSVAGFSIGAAFTDYDGDGDLDLFVTGLSQIQWRNDGNDQFTWVQDTEGGIPNGTGFEFDIQRGDYDNDGDMDIFVVRSGNDPKDLLYRNDGAAGFVQDDAALPDGPSRGWTGTSWGDYDNDGHLDLFICASDNTPNVLYHNEGDGTFSLVTDSPVSDQSLTSALCNWVDYDNDGDLDLFVANGWTTMQQCELFRNDGGTNHWIVVEPAGVSSSRQGYGAKIKVTATIGGTVVTQLREIGVESNLAAGTRAHFGLGDAITVDTLTIEWPSGAVQVMKNVSADQILNVTEMNMGGKLANISTRGQVGTGDGVLVAGLVITGALPQQVLIRASGQTLANYDVSNVLADTVLTIYTLEGDEIATNTNWGDAANASAIAQATLKVGAFVFPSDSTDSAILITLDPGAYTAQVRGNGGATGVAIVEVYSMN